MPLSLTTILLQTKPAARTLVRVRQHNYLSYHALQLTENSTLGYLIHPNIERTLPSTPQIIDIGTGTAAWSISVASSKPASKITSVDISDAQFPARSSLPSNIILKLHDMRQPFPSEMRGRFDLAHVRLLLAALPDQAAYTAAARNIATLLKPGGWLQWSEGDFPSCERPVRSGAVGTQSTTALRRGFRMPRDMLPLEGSQQVPEKMMRAFADAEMSELDLDTVASDRLGERGRKGCSMVQVRVLESMMRMYRGSRGQVPPLGESVEDDERLIGEIVREVEAGAYAVFFLCCVTGRKQG
ncbi:MAG: hypothetical protein Q9159_000428 [Coniocarpon cinnabarinum]